ncbi:hypothetical protein MPER_06580 [Moniliophthora perniciosa FA553]|nr:hypothetical protein MPER_06580 [Moniliophthora perniciosa FA553]
MTPPRDPISPYREPPHREPTSPPRDPTPPPRREQHEDVHLDVNLIPTSKIDDIALTQGFIKALRGASLDSSGLDAAAVERLRNPPQEPITFESREQRLSVELFISHTDAPESSYKETINAVQRYNGPDAEPLLSHDRVKRLVRDITGVDPIETNMCPNVCIAYVDQYAEMDSCPYCGQPRKDPDTKKPQIFQTIPFGFIMQALRRNHDTAKDMLYFEERC